MDRVRFCGACSRLILDRFNFCPWCGTDIKHPPIPAENWETAFYPLRLYVLQQKIEALDEELAALSAGGWVQ